VPVLFELGTVPSSDDLVDVAVSMIVPPALGVAEKKMVPPYLGRLFVVLIVVAQLFG